MKISIKKMIKNMIPDAILFYKGRPTTNMVALTFDDGPDEKQLPSLLELLEQENVKATFFLTGKRAEKYGNLVKEIQDHGHTIGSHLYNHKSVKNNGSKDIYNEISKTDAAIMRVTGKTARYIRPPYGDVNLSFLFHCIKQKKRIVLWSKDSKDSKAKSVEAIYSNIALETCGGGDILLFHEDSEYLIESIQYTISFLKKKGIGMGTIDEI